MSNKSDTIPFRTLAELINDQYKDIDKIHVSYPSNSTGAVPLIIIVYTSGVRGEEFVEISTANRVRINEGRAHPHRVMVTNKEDVHIQGHHQGTTVYRSRGMRAEPVELSDGLDLLLDELGG